MVHCEFGVYIALSYRMNWSKKLEGWIERGEEGYEKKANVRYLQTSVVKPSLVFASHYCCFNRQLLQDIKINKYINIK